MSKNFEKEYKEYLNAQAPDLWDRIEAGVDALGTDVSAKERARTADAEKVVPISGEKSKKAKKKRQIRYQHYRMIVSVAACLFALIIMVPVYLLTRPADKGAVATDSAHQMVENVTIQNLVVDSSESEVAMEESAPMEEITDDVTEIEIVPEESVEEMTELAQVTEENNTGTGREEAAVVADDGENGGQVASSESTIVTEETDILSEAAGVGEDSVPAQEQMQVTILGEGTVSDAGVIYTATVIGSTSSATVELLVPVGSEIVFETEKVYTLTVQISEDGTRYVVVAVVE